MIKNSFLIFFLFINTCIFSQDIHFTQFDASALTLNPALSGFFDGDIRVNGMYRTQWKAIDDKEYKTIGIGIDKQYHYYIHSYSVGLQFIHDETGYIGLITDKLDVSGAFKTKWNRNVFSGGFQLGGVYKTTKITQYTFDEQYDLGGEEVFNSNLPTSEIAGKPVLYFNFNAGLMWERKINKHFKPQIGLAFYHINTPNESFFDHTLEGTSLAMRTVMHIGGEYSLNKRLAVRPTILYMRQLKATDFVLGGNAVFSFSQNTRMYGGMVFRYSWVGDYDASAFVGGLEYKRYRLGLSYDVNISTLKTATNNRGAFELSLTYITQSVEPLFIKIPCDRQ